MHIYIAIFELVRPYDNRTMPRKFHDDISNSSVFIVLTDRHTDKQQTDTTENNTTLAACVVMTWYQVAPRSTKVTEAYFSTDILDT